MIKKARKEYKESLPTHHWKCKDLADLKDGNVCVCLPSALDVIFCSSFSRCPVIKSILQYTESTDGPEQPGVKHTKLRFVLPLSFGIPVYITQMQKFKSCVSQKSILRVCWPFCLWPFTISSMWNSAALFWRVIFNRISRTLKMIFFNAAWSIYIFNSASYCVIRNQNYTSLCDFLMN